MEIKECPSCKAPCTFHRTEFPTIEDVNECGDPYTLSSLPITKYTFVGSKSSVDDIILIRALEEEKRLLEIQQIRSMGISFRELHRRIENINLTIIRFKELLNLN